MGRRSHTRRRGRHLRHALPTVVGRYVAQTSTGGQEAEERVQPRNRPLLLSYRKLRLLLAKEGSIRLADRQEGRIDRGRAFHGGEANQGPPAR